MTLILNETTCPLWKKFEILFDTVPGPDGRPYTLTDLSETTGLAINSLSRLKTGRIEDPRLSTMMIIVEFYGISLDYFKCNTVNECYQFLQDELRRRKTVPQIALRVRAMSEDVLAEVQKMVAYIEQLETDEPLEDYSELIDD
jgi:transcriptional regulator with XRE-family HTH domain